MSELSGKSITSEEEMLIVARKRAAFAKAKLEEFAAQVEAERAEAEVAAAQERVRLALAELREVNAQITQLNY
eukprot:CAMPEP_0183733828 /NCGR_PEP_ID=MMETSP0737-20130205/42128_1 /TAXON_ID=385413 /ORGANISM="Thalassiosira miniscula, Strain CCMP1093" /LENGTH=72 /DNA_ID=CAMNT_0025967167 /DNA_START=80 /DNA_END=298 /DNA_ORIENTATION=+